MRKIDKSKFIGAVPKRRKRSELNKAECIEAIGSFFRKVERLKTSSEDFCHGANDLPKGSVTVTFQVKGGFGVADDMFEAMRVFSGYKLPRNDSA